MYKKIVYIANDGAQFETEQEALKRDLLDAEVRALQIGLPEFPRTSDVRIQVPKWMAENLKVSLIHLCRREYPQEQCYQHEPIAQIHPMGVVGRILSDSDGPIERAWRWLCCENDGFLYQQPYFALNPGEFNGKTISHIV